jgi:Trehalose utilisation
MAAGQRCDMDLNKSTKIERLNVMKYTVILLVGLFTFSHSVSAEVLIVADEFPAMQVLAEKLKAEENISSKVIAQKDLPENLSGFQAVAVYIHKDLSESAENAFIAYAMGGGKLVLIHHSISSGKRKNAHWFSFLGVTLPEGDVNHGGYKWIEGVSLDLVNLNPNHFIMTNKVTYPERVAFASANPPIRGSVAGFKLDDSEVYLNHVLDPSRTLLMGLKFINDSGTPFMQSHAGWIKTAGKGTVIYLMPGHTKRDFENPTYGRIVLNAFVYKP